MQAYIDSSVLISIVFEQFPRLAQWGTWDGAFTSAVAETECRRTVDRMRLEGKLSDEAVADAHSVVGSLLAALTTVDIAPSILERAGASMPTVVGTLDAIHLATALAIRRDQSLDLVFATHDRQQATAAIAMGFEVMGV